MRARPAPVDPPDYPLELAWVDLAPYRLGNTGIDHVHSFDSGVPGPHAMVNALTHGNELCGMLAVRRLLDAGVRPRAGRLTLSFANVAAYQGFAPDMLASRFVDRDLNRLWHDDLLAADHRSIEGRRAHAMLPLVRGVDRLLDLHSTKPVLAATDHLRLACSYGGFVAFRAGEIAAYDGDTPVTAPFDGAVLLAPRPAPGAGQQAFAWGRHVVD